MPNTLLILGGNGYIGRALAQEFMNNNWRVRKLNSRIPNFLEIEKEIMEVKNEDDSSCTLLNAAWSPKPSTNNRHELEHLKWVAYTSRLIELSHRCEIPYYGIGSGIEKGNFNDAYCRAKQQCSEIIVRNASMKNTCNTGWLRPHYVYSLTPPAPTLIRDISKQLVKSNTAEILSDNSHDYVSINECAAQIFRAVSNKLIGIVDIGSGKLTSNVNLVKKLFPGIAITNASTKLRKKEKKGGDQFTGKADIRWIDKIPKF
jgi:nucleoside-diphosphate-sugar epimerase